MSRFAIIVLFHCLIGQPLFANTCWYEEGSPKILISTCENQEESRDDCFSTIVCEESKTRGAFQIICPAIGRRRCPSAEACINTAKSITSTQVDMFRNHFVRGTRACPTSQYATANNNVSDSRQASLGFVAYRENNGGHGDQDGGCRNETISKTSYSLIVNNKNLESCEEKIKNEALTFSQKLIVLGVRPTDAKNRKQVKESQKKQKEEEISKNIRSLQALQTENAKTRNRLQKEEEDLKLYTNSYSLNKEFKSIIDVVIPQLSEDINKYINASNLQFKNIIKNKERELVKLQKNSNKESRKRKLEQEIKLLKELLPYVESAENKSGDKQNKQQILKDAALKMQHDLGNGLQINIAEAVLSSFANMRDSIQSMHERIEANQRKLESKISNLTTQTQILSSNLASNQNEENSLTQKNSDLNQKIAALNDVINILQRGENLLALEKSFTNCYMDNSYCASNTTTTKEFVCR